MEAIVGWTDRTEVECVAGLGIDIHINHYNVAQASSLLDRTAILFITVY